MGKRFWAVIKSSLPQSYYWQWEESFYSITLHSSIPVAPISTGCYFKIKSMHLKCLSSEMYSDFISTKHLTNIVIITNIPFSLPILQASTRVFLVELLFHSKFCIISLPDSTEYPSVVKSSLYGLVTIPPPADQSERHMFDLPLHTLIYFSLIAKANPVGKKQGLSKGHWQKTSFSFPPIGAGKNIS